ncbi:MAG TPA: glycosyltransferase family 4 protein [Rhodospirillaceae bacterium]|nr:glycosyltransferase family 4 protein [Rhodospirillaceae bacterium]
MRIAQVSPLHEAVPPRLYGGTERVVSYLTEELVAEGHQVTLFASGDSVTSAMLVPGCRQSLRLDPRVRDPSLYHLIQIDQVVRRQHDFDIVHFHGEHLHYPLVPLLAVPLLTTLHGRLDLPDLIPFYETFRQVPVSSISHHQRRPLPGIGWLGTVHHGLPETLLRPGRGNGGYFAFLGRISPEKGIERAVAIARRSGVPLKIAAKVDAAGQDYYDSIHHLLHQPGIDFIGEIGESEKAAFLGDALGLLFPIDWPEPFGLVMIEAMACGTPVLAFRQGSVPEIIENDVSGVIVDTVEQAVAAVGRLLTIPRERCRESFRRRFSAARMARDYLGLYRRLSPMAAGKVLAPQRESMGEP